MTERSRAKQSRSDFVFEKIYEKINIGEIQPGERLSQERIAVEYSVSQVTVREALNKLIVYGIAERRPRQGVFVPVITVQDAVDIYELRLVLEPIAWETAAEKITSTELERMRLLLPTTGIDSDTSTNEAARRSNQEFHMIPIQASGRWTLIRMLTQLLTMNNLRFLLSISSETDRIEDGRINIEEHVALIKALEERDKQRTRELITGHIQRSMKDRLELYREYVNREIKNIQ